jgi:hypothetical protein
MSMSVALPGFVFAPAGGCDVALAGRVPAARALPGGAPGGAVTFFCFAKRNSRKKRRPHFTGRQGPRRGPCVAPADSSALLGLAGKGLKLARCACSNSRPFLSVQPCAARRLKRGPQRVAGFAGIPSTGCRGAVCSLSVAVEHSFSAHATDPVRAEVSKCHANPPFDTSGQSEEPPQGERIRGGRGSQDRMPAQRATNSGPRLSRRAAQGWTDQKRRLSEHAKRASLSLFPSSPSSAEQLALGQPAHRGRLFFREFLLAKQKKVTAPPGAHPGKGRQAASPNKGEPQNTKRQPS